MDAVRIYFTKLGGVKEAETFASELNLKNVSFFFFCSGREMHLRTDRKTSA